MDSQTFRAHLDRELTTYADLLGTVDSSGAWGSAVPSCPGWAIRDLTHHLIGLHYWVTDAVNGGSGREFGPPMPDDREIAEAFLTSAAMLRRALDRDPGTACWTFAVDVASGGGTIGFWQRRQPHEHAIHRWDLEVALGLVPTLDPVLAADGIDEVLTMFWPRQVALGRTEEPVDQLEVVATETDRTWLLGRLTPGNPVATLTGSAADVLLALWGRIPPDSLTLHWSGDQAAGSTLLGLKIVP